MLRNRSPRMRLTAEERVFGPSFYPRGRRALGSKYTWGLLASAILVVLSAGAIFLLGVNIVIEYRTIVPEDRSGMTRKAGYIVLSAMGIYALQTLNVWFYKKVRAAASRQPNYDRLPTEVESYEMSDRS